MLAPATWIAPPALVPVFDKKWLAWTVTVPAPSTNTAPPPPAPSLRINSHACRSAVLPSVMYNAPPPPVAWLPENVHDSASAVLPPARYKAPPPPPTALLETKLVFRIMNRLPATTCTAPPEPAEFDLNSPPSSVTTLTSLTYIAPPHHELSLQSPVVVQLPATLLSTNREPPMLTRAANIVIAPPNAWFVSALAAICSALKCPPFNDNELDSEPESSARVAPVETPSSVLSSAPTQRDKRHTDEPATANVPASHSSQIASPTSAATKPAAQRWHGVDAS